MLAGLVAWLEETALFRFFANWKVATRIAAIATTGGIGLLLVGALYLFGTHLQEQSLAAQSRARTQLGEVQSLRLHMMSLALARTAPAATSDARPACPRRESTVDLRTMSYGSLTTLRHSPATRRSAKPVGRGRGRQRE